MKRLIVGAAIASVSFTDGFGDVFDTWHVRSAPAAAGLNLEGIAYGNGRWVAVGDDGIILSSTDGVEWNAETNPAPNSLADVVFGNGTFVAVGTQFNNLLTSPDGKTWTKQTPNFSGAFEMIYDGTRFVSVLAGGFVVTSSDGVTWTNLKTCPAKYDVGGVAFGNGRYVEAGYKRTGTPPDLYTTEDLTEWTQRDSRATENLMNVGYALGMFIAVGQKGTITTSPDGLDWTKQSSKHTGFIWDLASDGQHVVAAAQWGRVLTSSDGANWAVHETDLPWHLTDVAFGDGTFVLVGWDGQIVQSEQIGGETTETIRLSNPSKSQPFSFQFSSKAGQSYSVQSSSDLKAWAPHSVVTGNDSSTPVTDASGSSARKFFRVVKQ